MNTDVKFAIWCVRKCLHLWDAPEEVTSWLTDPKPELAAEAAEAAEAAWAARAAAQAAKAAEHAAQALDTTVGQLRLDYVATWTDEQLAQASGDWIEAATAEIFERAAEATT